jgi:hypothetical protein
MNFDPTRFLNYGLIGFCSLIVWLFWKILDREQRRSGPPRKEIVAFSWIFIFLSLILAVTGLTLELFKITHDFNASSECAKRISGAQTDLEKSHIYAATLEERVAAKTELIQRLDTRLAAIQQPISALPAATTAVVPVTRGEPVTSFQVELPENQKLKESALGQIAEARKLIAEAQK